MITHVPCGGTETIPAGRLLIYANQIEIDGVGSGLGYAGPDYVWYACPGVSMAGTMTFDVADLTVLSDLELELLYFHEMGHAIGFGSVPSKTGVLVSSVLYCLRRIEATTRYRIFYCHVSAPCVFPVTMMPVYHLSLIHI